MVETVSCMLSIRSLICNIAYPLFLGTAYIIQASIRSFRRYRITASFPPAHVEQGGRKPKSLPGSEYAIDVYISEYVPTWMNDRHRALVGT